MRAYQAQYEALASLKEGRPVRIAELEGRWLELASLLPAEAPATLALGEASVGGMALFAGEVHLRREGVLLRDVAARAWYPNPNPNPNP